MSAVEPSIDVVTFADLFAQHDDAEVFGFAGAAEKLLAGSHGMSVVVDVRGKFCGSLDNLGEGNIAPAERVRLQTYPVGMVHVSG